METEIKFDRVAFDHSKDNLMDAMGITEEEINNIYSQKVVPAIHELSGGLETASRSMIIEGILIADIPFKYKMFLWVELEAMLANEG